MTLPNVDLVKCVDADYLLFSSNDWITTVLRQTGKWEEHLFILSNFFIENVSNPLILDIGANLGAYSIPLAKKIQSRGGKVIAFEPQRIVYYQLCGNVFLNRLDNYEAINCAVGETKGEVELPNLDYNSAWNVGGFSVSKEYRDIAGSQISPTTSSYKVPMICLDNLTLEKSPDLIKLDVEGFELNVLKGAINFLKKHNYPPILFEVWGKDWFSQEKNALLSFISGMGYTTFNLNNSDDWMAIHKKIV